MGSGICGNNSLIQSPQLVNSKAKTQISQRDKQNDKIDMCEAIFRNNQIKRKSSQKHSLKENISQHFRNKPFKDSRTNALIGTERQSRKKRFIENNKKFVEESIETNKCVTEVLNLLGRNKILDHSELSKLKARNQKCLYSKENRYRNLEARGRRMFRNSEFDNSFSENRENQWQRDRGHKKIGTHVRFGVEPNKFPID